MAEPRDCYPTADEVDDWSSDLLERGRSAELKVRRLKDAAYDFKMAVRHQGATYLSMECPEHGKFYCYWQPCQSGHGPLLVHLPGYGAEMSAHPALVAQGYHVLHVNPQGYATPVGPDETKRPDGGWPVLPDTVRTLGAGGYVDWLTQAIAATSWALQQDGVASGRVAFFGSSQGGGTSLLMGSIFRGNGTRAVAADVPFLTDFVQAWELDTPGAYPMATQTLRRLAEESPDDLPAAWRALGFVDTLNHAHRLDMPIMLVAGAEDTVCPPPSIKTLFDALPGTRSYTELAGQGHAYTEPFLHLATAWFRNYV